MELNDQLLSGAGVVISLLGGGNLFFILRLVSKIDKSSDLIEGMAGKFEAVASKVAEHAKEIPQIRGDVDILKYEVFERRGLVVRRRNGNYHDDDTDA